MTGPQLWRTPPFLCTAWGKPLCTSTQSPQPHRRDLQVCHPEAVGEKNFDNLFMIDAADVCPLTPSGEK